MDVILIFIALGSIIFWIEDIKPINIIVAVTALYISVITITIIMTLCVML